MVLYLDISRIFGLVLSQFPPIFMYYLSTVLSFNMAAGIPVRQCLDLVSGCLLSRKHHSPLRRKRKIAAEPREQMSEEYAQRFGTYTKKCRKEAKEIDVTYICMSG